MTSSQTSEMVALYMKPKFPLVSTRAESSSLNFFFLGSEGQKGIVSRDFLKNVSIKESPYAILSPDMPTSIHALQKVDPLAKRWRAALSTFGVIVHKKSSSFIYLCWGFWYF